MPSATITAGRMDSTWRNRNGSHAATSAGAGFRFSGGRHLITLAMYTSSRLNPIASIIFVRSWPARPTKGMPWMSSSRPGASPTNIRRAFGFPTPNTIWRRPCWCSAHRVQSPRSSRIAGRLTTPARGN